MHICWFGFINRYVKCHQNVLKSKPINNFYLNMHKRTNGTRFSNFFFDAYLNKCNERFQKRLKNSELLFIARLWKAIKLKSLECIPQRTSYHFLCVWKMQIFSYMILPWNFQKSRLKNKESRPSAIKWRQCTIYILQQNYTIV